MEICRWQERDAESVVGEVVPLRGSIRVVELVIDEKRHGHMGFHRGFHSLYLIGARMMS